MSKEPDDVFEVKVLLSDKQTADGNFLVYEESPDAPEEVRLVLKLPFREWVASADTLFDALTNIRREMEGEGMLIACYGASRNVYPSPMARSMGYGERAYKLTMGKPATSADLVSIFDLGSDVDPVTIEEQERYYADWLRSLQG